MVSVVHISDLHFGERLSPLMAHALGAIRAIGPDLVVASGDITHAGRVKEYEAAAAFFAEIEAPVVACPGNHDAPVFNPVVRVAAPFARFARLGLLSAWDAPSGAVSVRAFNSARALQWRRDWSQGVYGADALATTARSFAASARHRVLVCHHPPHAPAGATFQVSTGGVNDSLTALQGPHLILCGHLHASADFAVDGHPQLRVLAAPTLASPRERGEGAGFRVLRFGEACQVETWLWTGETYAPRTAALA